MTTKESILNSQAGRIIKKILQKEIHSIGKRTCLTAQWEIRKIAKKMAKIIDDESPVLGKWVKPQCVTYGHCPESENCGYYKKQKK